MLATVTYLPALQAGWIWDDDSYILDNPAVQLPDGIVHAWVPGATPQYYPLVFVSFWVQHAVHGLETFGYHLVNLLLHLASSVLLWRVLVAFRLPGARPVTALQIDCIQSLWFESGAEMDAAFACLGDAVRAGEVHDDIFSAANSWSFQAEERVFFDQGRSLV